MHITRTEVTNIKSEHIFFFVLFLKNMGAVSCIKLPNEKRAGNEGHGCAVGSNYYYICKYAMLTYIPVNAVAAAASVSTLQ